MSNIAFMKCIGGRSEHIVRIYVMQALLIGLTGSVIGVVVGAFAQAAFARLVASYFDIAVILIWPLMAMLKGIAVGLTTAMLFSLPSLLSIFRSETGVDAAQGSFRESRPRAIGEAFLRCGHLAGLWANRNLGRLVY